MHELLEILVVPLAAFSSTPQEQAVSVPGTEEQTFHPRMALADVTYLLTTMEYRSVTTQPQ